MLSIYMYALLDFDSLLRYLNVTTRVSEFLPQLYYAFMASSSSSNEEVEDCAAFFGIETPHNRRRVSESTRLYDVFINHRGPDVKSTLALELYKSLEQLSLTTFLDSEEKELGVSFTSTIETAIRSAAVHIAIFSKGYAESPWCLEELVLMLRSKAKIIPVFFDVEPSALRYVENGVYGSAFSEYENKKRYMEKLEDWKAALQSVSFIAGERINSISDCENIISAVRKEIEKKRSLYVARYPVGLRKLLNQFQNQCSDKLVQDFESHCGMSKRVQDKSKIVGIFGMGGVGKTTLSKEYFNRKRLDYSRSSFLFDVREASVKCNLPSLQMKLLRDLFDVKDTPNYTSVDDGKSHLGSYIQRSGNFSFLIVLDDVDHLDQLDDLLIREMLDKSGNSMVIVTSRDVGLLKNAGITVCYHLKGLDTDEAKELFCWHAFRQSYPSSGWEELVNHFVWLCGGLPLSLQVLGSHVHGQDQNFWELELKKVKKTLPRDILKRLRISVDTLDDEEKQIFMDVACFFIGELKTDAIRVWEASRWSAQHALIRLKNKCLVEEIESYYYIDERPRSWPYVLRMHEHLRDLGRQMADELSHPRRLWSSRRFESWESKEFETILTQTGVRCLLSFDYIKCFLGESENVAERSTALLWHEQGRLEETLSTKKTLSTIPPWIPLRNLRSLKIFGGSLQRFWQNDEQAPFALKELQIWKAPELELILGSLHCLETIMIRDCRKLRLVKGMADLTKLVELNIRECRKIEELSLVQLMCLKKIKISDCSYLKSVAGISNLRRLVDLKIENCGKLEEEISFIQLTCLQNISILNCQMLKSLVGIFDLRNLVELQIENCPELEPEEISFVQLDCLEKIRISYCPQLKSIELKDCKNLREVNLKNLHYFVKLTICDCPELENLSELAHLHRLKLVFLNNCSKLKKISLPTTIIKLTLQCCRELQTVERICDCTDVEDLLINKCPDLELNNELSFARLSCLRTITIDSRGKIKKIMGNKKLQSFHRIQLIYCNIETVRDCILNMEKLPTDFIQVIGRAEDRAESNLNASFFFEEHISAKSVIQISTDHDCLDDQVSAIILCAVVVVKTSTAAGMINGFIEGGDWNPWLKFEVQQGEWLIASVITNQDEIHRYILDKGYYFPFDYVFTDQAVTEDVMVRKGYKVTLPGKKGEDHKALNLLRRIVDELFL